MKCRSEKHPHHAEGGGAGPAALRRCLSGWMDGWRWDGVVVGGGGGGGRGVVKDSVPSGGAHPRPC